MAFNPLPAEMSTEIASPQRKIRAQPAEPKWRMGRFQRHCQAGHWQKAAGQLQSWGRPSRRNTPFADADQIAIDQEQVCERVFRGEEQAPLPPNADGWLSAGIQLHGEQSRPALIPVRSPLADRLSDGQLRSALTTWEQREDDWSGHAARVLATDSEEKSLLEVRRIDFD